METLTRKTLERLSSVDETQCATVLMPTHLSAQQNGQDPIRFKNLLQAVEREWVALGMRAADARRQLHPLRERVEDALFWAHQSHGLAAFVSPDETLTVQVPESVGEHAVVDQRYYLLELMPVLEGMRPFFVLAISPKAVRLLEGTRQQLREVDLPEGVEALADLMQYIESEKQLQFHTGATPGGNADRAAIFHGHGGGENESERKVRLLEYCRLIDRRLRPVLAGRKEPLVLACEKRLARIYREANSYPQLQEQPLAGNPDLCSPSKLAAQAGELLRPQWERQRTALKTRAEKLLADGRAVNDLATVLDAAHQGRVETLLFARGTLCWGQFDAETRTVHTHPKRQPGDQELINRAAIVTWRLGGTVHGWAPDDLPNGQKVTAILRY